MQKENQFFFSLTFSDIKEKIPPHSYSQAFSIFLMAFSTSPWGFPLCVSVQAKVEVIDEVNKLFTYSVIHFGHLGFSKPKGMVGMRKRGDKTG